MLFICNSVLYICICGEKSIQGSHLLWSFTKANHNNYMTKVFNNLSILWSRTLSKSEFISSGYHLAECHHVPLAQVLFRENRSLAHLSRCRTVTCPSSCIHSAKCMVWSLIQVTSRTVHWQMSNSLSLIKWIGVKHFDNKRPFQLLQTKRLFIVKQQMEYVLQWLSIIPLGY